MRTFAAGRKFLLIATAALSACVPPNLANTAEKEDDGGGTSTSNGGSQARLGDFRASVAGVDKARLDWTANPELAGYTIYQVAGTVEFIVASVNAGAATSLYIGNLAPGLATFRLKSSRVDGTLYDPGQTASVVIPGRTLAWQLVQSAGPSTGSTTRIVETVAADQPFVRLLWKNSGSASTNVAAWKIFRQTAPSIVDIATDTPVYAGSTAEYVDTNVSPGQRLYYTAVGYDNQGNPALFSSETYVRIPPTHQVLVHRESANFEMCRLLGSEIDPKNYNRCPFTGSGGDGTYYDFGRSVFVDRYEVGVNVTERAGACGGTGLCKNTFNSFDAGSAANISLIHTNLQEGEAVWAPSWRPGATFIPGAFMPVMKIRTHPSWGRASTYTIFMPGTGGFYDTASYGVNTYTGQAGDYLLNLMNKGYTNAPKRPPANTPIPQLLRQGGHPCRGRITDGYGTTRLPSRREQVVYSAWPLEGELVRKNQDGLTLSWQTIESGDYHVTDGRCNTTSVSDLKARIEAAGSKTNFVYPGGDLTDSSYNWHLTAERNVVGGFVTGSNYTRNCLSRFGAQDTIGNVEEGVDLSFIVKDGNLANYHSARAAQDRPGSSQVPTEYVMDGTVGPGGSNSTVNTDGLYQVAGQNTPKTCVRLTNTGSVVTHFLPTYGFPYVAALHGAIPIGEGTGKIGSNILGFDLFCVDLRNDMWSIAGNVASDTVSYTGGRYGTGMNQNPFWTYYGFGYHAGTNVASVNQSVDGRDAYGRWSLVHTKTTGHAGGHGQTGGFRCVTEDN